MRNDRNPSENDFSFFWSPSCLYLRNWNSWTKARVLFVRMSSLGRALLLFALSLWLAQRKFSEAMIIWLEATLRKVFTEQRYQILPDKVAGPLSQMSGNFMGDPGSLDLQEASSNTNDVVRNRR